MESNKERYWRLKKAGLCVDCKRPAGGKSRCPKCMKTLYRAVRKSQRAEVERLRARVKELEGML